jgi:hypothetical protein
MNHTSILATTLDRTFTTWTATSEVNSTQGRNRQFVENVSKILTLGINASKNAMIQNQNFMLNIIAQPD